MLSAAAFSKSLADWFEENQRLLPWRGESDPYKIWISEIILQQTRVTQGWNYYLKFIERFPNVKHLAEAHLQDVLHLWQGLGYYSRARNLHAAAKQIIQEHQGRFPHNYLEIRNLKGVGNYTAAAIASIAFQLPYAAVDGNVIRVISRIFGVYDDVTKQKTVYFISQLCNQLMDKENPGTFNQAIMELGAIQCTPKNPKCENCPFVSQCVAFNKEHIHILPFKSLKIIITNRYFHYFIYIKDSYTIIEQRTGNDIWKNLYQFPMIETQNACNLVDIENADHQGVFLKTVKHKLSHQHLTIQFYVIHNYLPKLQNDWLLVLVEDLAKYPFPVVFKDLVYYWIS
ncbi:MAG: A/G-specific adenine glycosylase [Bacteroidales bacterium]|nr:A/G-specific adenine glycosylase [Bacteroidales bacterium]